MLLVTCDQYSPHCPHMAMHFWDYYWFTCFMVYVSKYFEIRNTKKKKKRKTPQKLQQKAKRDRHRMVVGLSPFRLWVRIPLRVRCTRYILIISIFFRKTRIIRSISDELEERIWYEPDNPCRAKKKILIIFLPVISQF